MFWIDVVSRLTHIATAVLLLGGSLFSLLVLLPVLQSQTASVRGELSSLIRRRWQPFVHGGILLFLLSGFYNYIRAMPDHKGDGLYHAVIGSKIILALGVFFMASVLVGRSAKFESARQNSRPWLQLICLLGLIIVAMSGFVKVKSRQTLLSPAVQKLERTTNPS
jgi:uncharacterized membrane protein